MQRILLIILLIYGGSSMSQCDERFSDILSEEYELHSDIVYGSNNTSVGETIDLLLDVYEPSVSFEGLRPVVILAHGGSFSSGNKRVDEVKWFCEDLARHGIVAVSINYRLEESLLSLISTEQMVKAVIRAVEDFKAAIRFMHKQALEDNSWNIDPESIFIGGTSAGSIAALHTAYMDEYSTLKPSYQQWIRDLGIDTTDIAGNSGNPGYRDDIVGVINISGAIAELDFLNNNIDLPILSAHNTIDLSVPFKIGRPYFIPSLPLVAGSKPINYRIQELGGDTRLLVFPAINHVPHTDYDGGKLEAEYNQILDEMLKLIGEYATCDVVLQAGAANQIPDFNFYPNPASDQISWSGVPLQDIQYIRLHNFQGQKIKTYSYSELSGQTIPLDQLQNGMYLIELMTKDGKQGSSTIYIQN